jgi:hypothetical protein
MGSRRAPAKKAASAEAETKAAPSDGGGADETPAG